ncbi:uncharacterized protein [Dermacentor andersoni]|uniref:uncharacterized protein isoform X2 n=1 Tax=Dermacentor andersoni TaxID=34620 RepID=UPI002416E450|nr:uncharacterized protein LOC129385313 isoform X2 [Dermacentor andersoni]
MLRAPVFLAVLSAALMAAGGTPNLFGGIRTPFGIVGTPADCKLAATARMDSCFAKDRTIPVPVDLKVADGPDAAAEQGVAEGAAVESFCPLPPAVEHHGDDVVVTGSPLPQLTESEEGCHAGATPSTRSLDSRMCEEHGGTVYRCSFDDDEEGIDTSRCAIRRVNCPDVSPYGVMNPSSTESHDVLHIAGQFAELFCMAAARPTVSGPDSANTAEYLRNASAAEGSNADCEALFVSYAINVEPSEIFSSSTSRP